MSRRRAGIALFSQWKILVEQRYWSDLCDPGALCSTFVE